MSDESRQCPEDLTLEQVDLCLEDFAKYGSNDFPRVQAALMMQVLALAKRGLEKPAPAVFDPEFQARNSKLVSEMPDWKKGSPVNERKPAAASEPTAIRTLADWPACPTAQARPACRFTECRKSGGCENSDRWCERPADPSDKYDPRHALAQARPVTREQVLDVLNGVRVKSLSVVADEIMRLLEDR